MKLAPRLTADLGVLNHRFLSLKDPRDVAALLEVPYSLLVYLTYRTSKALKYHQFTIPKRSGGVRDIMSPNKSLKLLQAKLNSVLAQVYKPKPAAHGFVAGRSVVSNAALHCGRRAVLNIDLENFFPTINFGRVRGLFMAKPYGLPASVATVLAQLCCFENQLPQGAPTSPTISNMVCSRLDTQLELFAKRQKCFYTRYADDITFSTFRSSFSDKVCVADDNGVQLGADLVALIAANGFSINLKKVHLQRSNSHQEVTGLTVNRRPNVRRGYIRQVRAMLHAWEKFGLDEAAREHFRYRYGRLPGKGDLVLSYGDVVRGKIAYLGMVRGKDGLYRKFTTDLDRLMSSIDPATQQKVTMGAIKVFISHSAKDEILATALVQCLESSLEVPDGDIRCTSVHGYKLDPGADANETLRVNLEQCTVVIGLLTEDSLQSGFVIMELGAAWGLRKITYPLLGTKVQFGRIPGPLAATHAIKIDSGADVTQLVHVIAQAAGYRPRNPAKVAVAVEGFVKVAASVP